MGPQESFRDNAETIWGIAGIEGIADWFLDRWEGVDEEPPTVNTEPPAVDEEPLAVGGTRHRRTVDNFVELSIWSSVA